MEEFALRRHNDEEGISRNLRVACEESRIRVLAAHVYVDHDIVILQQAGEIRVVVQEAIEQNAPGAPVAANVQQDIFMLGGGLLLRSG